MTEPLQANSRSKLYLLNGQILKFAIETWAGLILGFAIANKFAPKVDPTEMESLKIKIIVFSMIGVTFLGSLPWLKDPNRTWRWATSEPGNLQGVCNRCAAFLPIVGVVVLLIIVIFWLLLHCEGIA